MTDELKAAKQEIERRAIVAILADELLGEQLVLGLLREALDRYVDETRKLSVLPDFDRTEQMLLQRGPAIVYLRHPRFAASRRESIRLCRDFSQLGQSVLEAPWAALELFALLWKTADAVPAGRLDYREAVAVLDRIERAISALRSAS